MSHLKKVARPALAVLVLGLLAWKGPFKLEQLKFALSQPDILLIGFLGMGFQNFIFSVRWRIFVNKLLPDNLLSFASAFKMSLVGLFFSFFIPGGVGGDVVKALELSREKNLPRSKSLSTVLADRILGLFSILLFSSTSLALDHLLRPSPLNQRLLFSSTLLLIGMMAFLFFSKPLLYLVEIPFKKFEGRITEKLVKLIQSFELTTHSFREAKLLFRTISLTLVAQILSISFLYFVVIRLHGSAPHFFIFFSLCCFGFVASAIPITPAGIGVGQAAFYFLFSQIDPELGTTAITALSLYQIFQLMISLAGGYFFTTKGKLKIKTV